MNPCPGDLPVIDQETKPPRGQAGGYPGTLRMQRSIPPLINLPSVKKPHFQSQSTEYSGFKMAKLKSASGLLSGIP